MMFARWRYRGRHRDSAWTVDALTAAVEAQRARALADADARFDAYVDAVFADVLIRDYVPPLPADPGAWGDAGLCDYITAVHVDLWLPSDTAVMDYGPGGYTLIIGLADDDDLAYHERLMGTAGA